MYKTNLIFKFLFVLAIFTGFQSCGDDEEVIVDPVVEEKNIVGTATDDGRFTTLIAALNRTGLTSTLEGDGPFTVFAPTDDAFTALGVNLDDLSDDDLTGILLYHVFGASIESKDLAEGQTYATTANTKGPGDKQLSLLIEKSTDGVKLNNVATVTTADVSATNGVIHVIDAVLQPLDVVGHAAANSNFTSLVGAVSDAGLVETLSGDGPFTVFAPVNSAFEAISDVVAGLTTEELQGILTYHVAAGNVVSGDLTDGMEVPTVNTGKFTVTLGNPVTITDATGATATVLLTDVQGTNGVIHVIDKVLLP